MARVHSSCSPPPSRRLDVPGAPPQPAAASARHRSEQREVFTIWMKSLVLNGSGCTVYDSGGRIVYRVDNYSSRRAADVCLMDLAGNVVLQILKKTRLGFGRWDGYRCSEQEPAPRVRPWFKVVSKAWRGGGPCCEFRSDADGRAVRYKMEQQAARTAARIVDDATGFAVAEVKRKMTATGVALGDDVLTLVVEPNVDHSLIMGLLLVHGLINHTM